MIARFLSRATKSPASRSAWWCLRKMFNFIRKLIKSFWYDEKWISFFLWKKYFFFRNCGVVLGVAPKISMIWSVVIFESPPFPDFWLLGSARVYFILPGLTVLMVLSESVTMQSSSIGGHKLDLNFSNTKVFYKENSKILFLRWDNGIS